MDKHPYTMVSSICFLLTPSVVNSLQEFSAMFALSLSGYFKLALF